MENVREIAIKAIKTILKGEELPKKELEKFSGIFNERDRAFLKELVYGVIRYRDTLDWNLKPFLKKPSQLKALTLNNLRIALYQIIYLRVPEWAAINESVEIEKKWGTPALINGVLRNYLRKKEEIQLPSLDENPISHISITTSHPQWLIRRWIKRFGIHETLRLARANNTVSPPTLRINAMNISRKDVVIILERLGIKHELTRYSPHGIRLKETLPFKALEPLMGKIFIQDEAAQLISFLLTPERVDYILDACAAPGGKATHIASLTGADSFIIAVDNKEERIKRLKKNIDDLNIKSIKPVIADIKNISIKKRFDKILLDAPCSSTGTIRKNPDIKYKISSKRLKEYIRIQTLLLDFIAKTLKKKGRLVYSVCSTEPEEGEGVIRSFLQKNPEYYIINTADEIKSRYGIDLSNFSTDKLFYRTFPHLHNMEGFFFTTLTRK